MTLLSALGYFGIGSLIGLISYLILQERGIKLIASVLVGAIGGFLGAIIPEFFELSGAGYYCTLSSVSILLTFNVFRTKEQPVFE